MHYLTRRFSFSAAHRLWDPSLDEAANRRLYGDCTHLHGHNYRLEVTVRGQVDAKVGFACNVLDIKRIVEEAVVDRCDHRTLNETDLFAGIRTTMECLAGRIWEVLEPRLKAAGLDLYEVLLAETDDNLVRLRSE